METDCFTCKMEECDETSPECWRYTKSQARRLRRRVLVDARSDPELPDGYMTIAQFARKRGITSQAVCNQIRNGRLQAHPVQTGNRLRRLIQT